MSDERCPKCDGVFVRGHHMKYLGPAGAKEYLGPIDGKYCLSRQLAAAEPIPVPCPPAMFRHMGKPISRAEAIKIANETMDAAERERAEAAQAEGEQMSDKPDPPCPMCGAPADWRDEDLLSGQSILALREELAAERVAREKAEAERDKAYQEGYVAGSMRVTCTLRRQRGQAGGRPHLFGQP